MKKLRTSIGVLVILLASVAANASWTSSFTIGTVKNVSDGRIIFTNAATGDLVSTEFRAISDVKLRAPIPQLFRCRSLA
jgi:hypothetical protein